MRITSTSSVPAYEKIARQIKASIHDGQYTYGSALPSETKLCEEYDVSRITIRRAVNELVDDGYLEKVHGKGTFVKYHRFEQELLNLSGFTEAFGKKGIRVSHHIIEETLEPADLITRKQLQIDKSENMLKIVRLHYLDESPFSLDTSYFPESKFPGLFELLKENDSLYDIMKKHFNMSPLHADRTITIATPTEQECQLLECDMTEPLFKMEKLVLDEDKPLHRSVLLTPSSRVSLKLRM